jgi:hypothetical protein
MNLAPAAALEEPARAIGAGVPVPGFRGSGGPGAELKIDEVERGAAAEDAVPAA